MRTITGAEISLTRKQETQSPWQPVLMGAPAEIFPEGAKPPTIEKVDTLSARRTENRPFFGAPKAQTNFFCVFCDVLD